MTYEELVKKVKKVVEKIDKGAVKEHAAIEIDIEGEGEGAFYVNSIRIKSQWNLTSIMTMIAGYAQAQKHS